MQESPSARPHSSISAAYSAFQPRLPGMTQVAVFRSPGDLVVVAHAAKFTVYYIQHVHIVGTGAHLETKLTVAYLAAKTGTMKPVRKNHRAHARFLCTLV